MIREGHGTRLHTPAIKVEANDQISTIPYKILLLAKWCILRKHLSGLIRKNNVRSTRKAICYIGALMERLNILVLKNFYQNIKVL